MVNNIPFGSYQRTKCKVYTLKVYTRFQTKTAQKPYPMGRHIPMAYIKEYPRSLLLLKHGWIRRQVLYIARDSLRSRRLEVVGTRKNGRARKETREGTPRAFPSRTPVLSFAHYFQAPATQANLGIMFLPYVFMSCLSMNVKQ